MAGTVQTSESSADPAAVFAVAAVVASYPEWINGILGVEILEGNEAGLPLRARFEADAYIKRISYELEYSYDPPHLIEWKAVPGPDIESMEGSYRFVATGSGCTQIVYALSVEPAFSIPGFLLRQAEKQIVTSALRGLRRRAEGASAD